MKTVFLIELHCFIYFAHKWLGKYLFCKNKTTDKGLANFVTILPSIGYIFSKLALSFALFISRFFVYYLFTDLFKLKGLANVHYFKSMQTNLQFFTVLFAVLCFYAVYVGPAIPIDFTYFLYVVDFYFAFRFIYFFQSFQRSFSYPRLFLFIYLLIIEGQIILFGIRELIFPTYI